MNLLTRQCVVEFIGTFSLTFIGAGAIIATGGENLVAIAFAHGLALSMAVYASGHISGGHINPAVPPIIIIGIRSNASATEISRNSENSSCSDCDA